MKPRGWASVLSSNLAVRVWNCLCASNVVRGMQMHVGKLPVRLGIYLRASNVVRGMQMHIGKLPMTIWNVET